MTFDGRAVANEILDTADEQGIQLSNLALQKVIFFCHAWQLVETDQPLVKNQFEAWQHGPVLQYLYRQFKNFDSSPITGRAKKMDPQTGEMIVAYDDFDQTTLERIARVVGFYGRLEPWDLVELSHKRGGPWDKVWNHEGRINPGMKIQHDAIKEFYSVSSELGRIQ